MWIVCSFKMGGGGGGCGSWRAEWKVWTCKGFVTRRSTVCSSGAVWLEDAHISSVQSLSRVRLFATPWTAACQASLSITNSCFSLKNLKILGVQIPQTGLLISDRRHNRERALGLHLFTQPLCFCYSTQSSTLPGVLQSADLCFCFSAVGKGHWPGSEETGGDLGVLFSCSVVSDSLWLRGLKQARLPCPSPSPRACLNSCSLNQWCHPTISSSVIPFSFYPVFPSIRVFSNESIIHIMWPKYWSFSFSISPSSEYLGLISFRIDWFELLAVHGTLESLLQHHSLKASVLQHSAFFMVQLSHPYMTTGKSIALTIWTFVSQVSAF